MLKRNGVKEFKNMRECKKRKGGREGQVQECIGIDSENWKVMKSMFLQPHVFVLRNKHMKLCIYLLEYLRQLGVENISNTTFCFPACLPVCLLACLLASLLIYSSIHLSISPFIHYMPPTPIIPENLNEKNIFQAFSTSILVGRVTSLLNVSKCQRRKDIMRSFYRFLGCSCVPLLTSNCLCVCVCVCVLVFSFFHPQTRVSFKIHDLPSIQFTFLTFHFKTLPSLSSQQTD